MTITILRRAVDLERALGELRLNRDTHLLTGSELSTEATINAVERTRG